MKLKISHNLTNDQLQKAVLGLVSAQGMEAEVADALLKAAGCSCDGPKEPRDAPTRELLRQFRHEYALAVHDIVRAVDRRIKAKDTVTKSHVKGHQRHYQSGKVGAVAPFYRAGEKHGPHVLTPEEAARWAAQHPHSFDAYHGTTEDRAKIIGEEGFDLDQTRGGKHYGNAIYVTTKIDEANYWARHGDKEAPAILKVKIIARNPVTISPEQFQNIVKGNVTEKEIVEESGGSFVRALLLMQQKKTNIFRSMGHDVVAILEGEKPENVEMGEWLRKHGGNQIIVYSKDDLRIVK
jgi:hypothetical protein